MLHIDMLHIDNADIDKINRNCLNVASDCPDVAHCLYVDGSVIHTVIAHENVQ